MVERREFSNIVVVFFICIKFAIIENMVLEGISWKRNVYVTELLERSCSGQLKLIVLIIS